MPNFVIGIHDRPGSFSDRWFEYCQEHKIAFKRLDCLATDAIRKCHGLNAVLWHWASPRDQIVARHIITALEARGVKVFPDLATCWHYDDKIAQKYVLEAIEAPLVPTWVFTDRGEAMAWIAGANWPKVFKLRCGAGSRNVRLAQSRSEAETLCRTAFGRGFPPDPQPLPSLRKGLNTVRSPLQFWEKLKLTRTRLARATAFRRQFNQQGYIYFQEFLPGNAFDTRVTVIGHRAFAFIRRNRADDFRASGSGLLGYDAELVDKRCVETAFDVARGLRAQSLAFDFLFDSEHSPRICEISYCYVASAVHACPGHWDRQLTWQPGHIWPQDAILEDLIAQIRSGERPTRESLPGAR